MDISARLIIRALRVRGLNLTLNTYSHVLPSLQKEAVSRLDTLLANQETPVAVNLAKTVGNSGRKKNKPASKAG
jgi:hypothetical protein